ncbi:MAG TPA: hypothetical protein VEX68_10965 [Bryobacteraceae bacterium]|nr:hypothetical protein [Bryobacteraceae bacterium]
MRLIPFGGLTALLVGCDARWAQTHNHHKVPQFARLQEWEGDL